MDPQVRESLATTFAAEQVIKRAALPCKKLLSCLRSSGQVEASAVPIITADGLQSPA
jgi:hypothetical protein